MADGAADLIRERLDRVEHRRQLHLVRENQREAFTAAAQRLYPERKGDISGALSYRQSWQEEAWDNYDDIPEVGRSADFVSDAMSRVRWFPGIRLEPDGDVLPLDATDENDQPLVPERDRAEVEDAFRRLGGVDVQSIAGLFAAMALQFFVPGEGYLLGYTPEDDPAPDAILTSDGEVWEVVAAERLKAEERAGTTNVTLMPWKPHEPGKGSVYTPQGGGKEIRLPPDAFIFRMWQPHPRDRSLARSAVRRVYRECEELRIKLLAIRAQELQRMNAGILVVPSSASLPAINESRQGIPQSPLAKQIVHHIVTPIKDPGSAAAAAPYVLEADLRDGQEVKWIKAPNVDRKDIEEREELSRRIVMALPVPTESILGLGEEANYANARIITEQQWLMYLAPQADELAEAFAIGYLRREIAARNVADPWRYAIGADGTALYQKPSPEDAAGEAHERLTISDDYYRDVLGIPPEAAPSDEEIERRIIIAQRMKGGAPTGEPAPEVDDESTDPNAEEPEPMAAAATVTGAKATRLSRRIAKLESELRARVHAYLAGLIDRAVEKAGAKARTNARRNEAMSAAIGQVENRRVCAQLGPAMVAALNIDDEAVLEDVLASGEAQVKQWIAAAQDDALRLAARLGSLEEDRVAELQARQEEDRGAAWLLLLAALTTVARARLFDPDPTAPEVGEFDASPLPMAPVAAGLARAGGASGSVITVPYAGTRLPAAIEGPDGEPVQGGATAGPTGQEALSSAGFALVSWTWETGNPDRPFEPHQDLEGLEFRSFFDERLANTGDWPSHPFYFAGDHAGCLCQQVPSFEEAPS